MHQNERKSSGAKRNDVQRSWMKKEKEDEKTFEREDKLCNKR